jgi:opacity protein-like surface antigen
MMRRPTLAASALVLAAASVFADEAPPPKSPPSGESFLALGLEGGYFHWNPTESATAVLGSASGFMFGGEVRFAFKNGIYAAAGGRHFSKDGQRVFVAAPGSPVFPLGFPLQVSLTPFDFVAGYRFGGHRWKSGARLVPYLGVGLEVASYNESSVVAGETEQSSQTKAGAEFLGGLEYFRRPWSFGVELAYSTVSGAIGVGGVSQVFGETNIGGFRVMAKVGYSFMLGAPPGHP